jgi:hypothetical protein
MSFNVNFGCYDQGSDCHNSSFDFSVSFQNLMNSRSTVTKINQLKIKVTSWNVKKNELKFTENTIYGTELEPTNSITS